MAVFNTTRFIPTQLKDLSGVVDAVKTHFESQEYLVSVENSAFGAFVSLTKGGIFKAVLGMKSSLNIEIQPAPNGLSVSAKVGIFGQQVIPSLIMYFVAWPVILTQIVGLVKQSKLDDEALDVIEAAVHRLEDSSVKVTVPDGCFCVSCGASLPSNSAFCNACGAKQ